MGIYSYPHFNSTLNHYQSKNYTDVSMNKGWALVYHTQGCQVWIVKFLEIWGYSLGRASFWVGRNNAIESTLQSTICSRGTDIYSVEISCNSAEDGPVRCFDENTCVNGYHSSGILTCRNGKCKPYVSELHLPKNFKKIIPRPFKAQNPDFPSRNLQW